MDTPASNHFLRVVRALAFVSTAAAIGAGCSSEARPDGGFSADGSPLCPTDPTVDGIPCTSPGLSCTPYTSTACLRCGYSAAACGFDTVTCSCAVADGGSTPTWSCTALCATGPLLPPESSA